MQEIQVIGWAGVYCLYATAVCVCCGLLSLRLLASDAQDVSDPEASRLVLSNFLLGSGFGPWVMGLLQIVFLIVCAGLPPLLIAAMSLAAVGVVLYCLRDQASRLLVASRDYLAGNRTRRLGAALVTATVLFTGAFALRAASIPLWHGDTLIYAYEAKALRDSGSYTDRLGHTPTPNAHNFIRKNDHPLTYIGYMVSGLYFSPERGQDLSMRLALQVQNVLLVVTLAGLGLRLGGAVGGLAPLLLLFANYFGALIDMSHREAFRIIPVFLCFGFLPGSGARLCQGRAALLFASMLFLWNAHTGSVVVAPIVLACQFLALRDWRSRGLVIAFFLLGFLLGANHLLDSYLKTGDPLGFEFAPQAAKLTRIAPVKRWCPSGGPPPTGLAWLHQRLANQWNGDGGVAVATVFLGLSGAAWFAVRRKSVHPVILTAAFFCLVNEMQVLGFFDWINPTFGNGLYSVARYRFVLYPFGVLLCAGLLGPIVGRLRFPLAAILGLLLFAGGAASALAHWERTPLAPCLVRDAAILDRLVPVKSCWGPVAAHLGETDPSRPVILTDATMIPWYYTDWRVLNIYDPRLEKARLTKSPEEALEELDRLGIGAVILNKAKFLSGTAIEAAVESPAYEKFVDCIYDEGFRRVAAKP
jgi:hypothetical protein